MAELAFDRPHPDFEGLVALLQGERAPEKEYLAEILVELEVMERVDGGAQGQTWVSLDADMLDAYPRQFVDFYFGIGHDFARFVFTYLNLPEFKSRVAVETAAVWRGERDCVEETALRGYVRGVLDARMPGRYAIGSGNSVTNCVRPESDMAMLDEAEKWGQENLQHPSRA